MKQKISILISVILPILIVLGIVAGNYIHTCNLEGQSLQGKYPKSEYAPVAFQRNEADSAEQQYVDSVNRRMSTAKSLEREETDMVLKGDELSMSQATDLQKKWGALILELNGIIPPPQEIAFKDIELAVYKAKWDELAAEQDYKRTGEKKYLADRTRHGDEGTTAGARMGEAAGNMSHSILANIPSE